MLRGAGGPHFENGFKQYIMEIIYGIFSESFWWVAPILMTLTVAISGVINGWLKLVTFGDPVWLGVVALCVVVGLSSNGLYDIPTIKAFVDSWFYPRSK